MPTTHTSVSQPPVFDLPEDLLRQLEPLRKLLTGETRNAVVPFVGSGLSRGLKSWHELLNALALCLPETERDDVARDIAASKFLDVANFLESHLGVGPARIRPIIEDLYGTSDPPPALYEAVAALPTKHFATTNYDGWLANAVTRRCGHIPMLLDPRDGAALADLDTAKAWVFHLHGMASKPDTCVLTAGSYRRLLSGNPPWRKAVESLIQTRHLLFLGTSLSEPHLDVLFGEFEQAFHPEGGKRRHWWLGIPSGSVERHRLENLGIEVVDYGAHDRLPAILAWLGGPKSGVHDPAPAPSTSGEVYDPARPYFYVPYPSKGEGMIGRKAAVAAVREKLLRGRPTSIGQAAAFTGLGGIGKTQLAAEYCWTHRSEYPGGVYWFTVDQDVEGQILRLVDEARWIHPTTEAALKLEVAYQRLRTVAGALFVYDNVEERVPVDGLSPACAAGSHVLITSRVEQPSFERLEIDLLQPAPALELFVAEADRAPDGPDEKQAARDVCEYLDGLPLALEVAGAFLRRHPGRTFVEYRDLLNRRGSAYTETAVPHFAERSTTKHQAGLADTLRVSRALIDEHRSLNDALDVLAWSATAPMGWSLLVHLVAPDDADELRNGVDVATGLHVLRQLEENGAPRFRMHRLVQEVRRSERPVVDADATARAVLDRLSGWFAARRDDFNRLDEFEAELDHLGEWIRAADTLGVPPARVQLRWLQAYPHWHRGQYAASLEELDAALALYDEARVEDSELLAKVHADRNSVLSALGRPRDALTAGEHALDLRVGVLGERHPDTATSYNNVGATYGALGDHKKALEFAEKALEIQRDVRGERHPVTAGSYNNVGTTYGALGDHKKALEFAEKALEIWRVVLGEIHPDTASSYNNVGSTYRALGDHKKALEFQEKALEIRRDVLGERHPDTASSYNNVGATYGALGDHKKALEFQEKALEIRRVVLGERHPDTASSYNNVGSTYRALGDHKKALEFAEKALEIQRDVLGERHPDTATAYNNVGGTYGALGDHKKELEFQEKALEIRRDVLGERHPDTASSYNNVGSTYRALGDHKKALEFAEKALEIQRDVLGERHPVTAGSYNNVGTTYGALGDHKKALEFQKKALEIRRDVLGERHPVTAGSYNNVGTTYGALGDHKKALEFKEKALEIQRVVLGELHIRAIGTAINVLFTLRSLGRKPESFALVKPMLKTLPWTSPRYGELVAAYNWSCPAGSRTLPTKPPYGQKVKPRDRK